MKIVFLCEAVFPENKGGVERWFSQLSAELSRRGHEVHYFNATGVNGNRNGVQHRSITPEPWFYLPGGVRSKRQAIRFAKAAYRELRSIEADAIYATSVPILSVFPVGLIGSVRKRTTTIVEWFEIWPLKYWIQYSGFLSGVVGWAIQLAALQVGRYRIVYTERASNSLKSLNLRLRGKNIIRLSGLCSPVFVRQEDDVVKVRNDISFLGRFVDEKQPLLAIQGVMEFIKTGWAGTFWVIGKGPSLTSMKKLLEMNPNAAKQINIIEDATDEIVSMHLRNSFALLHPSKREGYGLASVEAAYSGTPSVLLDYPNNATLDLGISPELVVTDLSPSGIASKLNLAFHEQASIRMRTLNWASNAALHKSITSTADQVEKLLGVSNAQGQ
jgi:glycosyltransferase involved in cell wall biosynthesis